MVMITCQHTLKMVLHFGIVLTLSFSISFLLKIRFRQYGLWDRYTDVHPEYDQTFTIGISDPKKDWFFAHVDRFFSFSY